MLTEAELRLLESIFCFHLVGIGGTINDKARKQFGELIVKLGSTRIAEYLQEEDA